VWALLGVGGGRSRRQGNKPRSGGNVELLSESLVDDVCDGVLQTLLGDVAERRHPKHITGGGGDRGETN